jgi:hypothetical protein
MTNVVSLRPGTLPFQAQAEEEDPTQPGPEDDRFWSVTTLMRAIGTDDGLIHWSAQRAADAALGEQDVWMPMARRHPAEARKWLANARYRPRAGHKLMDADIGTAFHRCAEEWVVTGTRPPAPDPDVDVLLDSFAVWLDHHQPEHHAAELTVYNPTYHYAGTLDGIADVGGYRWVIDYKTSLDSWKPNGERKRPFQNVCLQVAAYRWAEFAAVWRSRREEKWGRRTYLLSPTERAMAVPMPPVDGALVVHVTPEHVDTYPVRCDEMVFHEGFLCALDAFAWLRKEPDMLGTPAELNVRRPS